MLEYLHIKNLALVPEAEIEFGSGFNVLTGETGTGKSLVIGALRLVTGQRASRHLIREGKERCDISAGFRIPETFQDVESQIQRFLTEQGIQDTAEEDGQLLLRRAITGKGSRCFVNGTAVPLKTLANVGELLVDIHGPEQHHSLLQPSYQRQLLDSYAGINSHVKECSDIFDAWREINRALEQVRASAESEDVTLLREQVNEIRNAEIQPEEDQQIAERHALLSRSRDLVGIAEECRRELSENENAVTDQLSRILNYCRELEEGESQAGRNICERLEETLDALNDIGGELEQYVEAFDFDESEYNALEERIGTLQRLKRKYGSTLEDVLETADDLEARCTEAENREADIEKKQQRCEELHKEYQEKSEYLRTERKRAAEGLAEAISDKLINLGFNNSLFQIDVSPADMSRWGQDHVEFLFAPNAEQTPLPIREIASSGEIARVLLAVKTVLSSADNIPTLVFDEVDANVGGNVAVRVAEELASIGQRHQTLCITHLPQIASAGERHYRVMKSIRDNRTVTELNDLDATQREKEIARMLGWEGDSQVPLDHAREMLGESRSK